MCGLGLEHSTVTNPLHITSDGAAGFPAEVTLADRSINSVALHGSRDDPQGLALMPEASFRCSDCTWKDALVCLLSVAAGADGVDT